MAMSRRDILFAAAAAAPLAGAERARAEAAVLGEDGLYRQPWFSESFLELRDDLEAAGRAGKRLAVMWELRGCPYCKETHLVNFARPEIASYVRDRFEILQLNVIGSKEATDFDGARLSEKALAERYGIRFTPSFQFFPASLDGLDRKAPREREVARAQGYLEPRHFLLMFRFVAENAYRRMSLRDYLRAEAGEVSRP